MAPLISFLSELTIVTTATDPAPRTSDSLTDLNHLAHVIGHAAHLLPTQGPIAVFVHHNTLHPFEGMPFDEAVKRGADAYGCQPYLTEDRYRQALATERIQASDLHQLLEQDLGDEASRPIGPIGTVGDLRLAMLQFPLCTAPDVELRWVIAESDSLRRFRGDTLPEARLRLIEDTRRWVMRDLRDGWNHASDRVHGIQQTVHSLVARFGRGTLEQWSETTWESFTLNLLWQICRQGTHGLPAYVGHRKSQFRHRDLLLAATQTDTDEWVHDLLVRFTGSFLDQGLATWSLPQREHGFLAAFAAVYGQPGGPPDRWRATLASELQRITATKLKPLELIAESLQEFGVGEDEWESFIARTLLALRGWAGMVLQMETNAEWTVRPARGGSFLEFLAVRLLLDRIAAKFLAADELHYCGPLAGLRDELSRREPHSYADRMHQRAYQVFQLAQLRVWRPEDLYLLSKSQWRDLIHEIEAFSPIERRRILHQAYELRYRRDALDALSLHQPAQLPWQDKPLFQVSTCIDDREESFRRHLEEIIPQCETFGAPGFFAVPMYYRGLAEALYLPLCPIVIKPQHFVQEDVAYTFTGENQRRAKTRRAVGTATHQIHLGSRGFIGGAIAAIAGSLASFPLVARVLFPRLTAQIRKHVGSLVQPPRLTQLELQRTESQPSEEEGHRGFTLEEMVGMVERLLRDIGLTKRFSDLFIILGHGSSSLNNPHESAYNCGACGGGRGGPNARAMSAMANDPRVRRILTQRGLDLPPELHFVGGYHNTCDDSVVFFDLDRLPMTHRKLFEQARRAIDQACERNAHERSRRFELAPLNFSFEAALRHVEERSEDLSQARPEYNHATCAMCFVGRRERTRGLFLDRRSFMNSYDPTQDDEKHSILARILGAAIPVCAGISLEYYFSSVDPVGWGCGSKLPHNITSMLGVMEGAASDLRTGLSQQMVEIHEPVRILFVIETTAQGMLTVIEGNPTIKQLCYNRWVQLAVLDPHSQKIQLFQGERFVPYQPLATELPIVKCSTDWYRGWRDHLGFAEIKPQSDPAGRGVQ